MTKTNKDSRDIIERLEFAKTEDSISLYMLTVLNDAQEEIGQLRKISKEKIMKTWYDEKTGLEWSLEGKKMTYNEAVEYVSSIGSRWRLPTLKEAMTLIKTEKDLKKASKIFGDICIWTSDKFSASAAWYVSFDPGYCGHLGVAYDGSYVRAVRSGQSS